MALDVAGLDEVLQLPSFDHVDRPMVQAVLEEFGRFAAEVVVPTDRIGDLEGARLEPETGLVRTPAPFVAAYRQFVAGGWGAVAAPSEHGGGGFPASVGLALQEMLASANLALSLNPMLTQGAIELLTAWGSAEQRARFLPRLITGEWTGTMNLTEPEAGSDLGEIRTLATPTVDGGWRIAGSKIFITWGEHDLAENIVHLVLARTPDAPAGTRGLSIFVVPKFRVDGRRKPRRAQHTALRAIGEQARHTRQPDLRDDVRRRGSGAAGRRARRHPRDVHHDERRALGRRDPGPERGRTGLPACPSLRRIERAGPGDGHRASRSVAHHRASRRAPAALVHADVDPGRPPVGVPGDPLPRSRPLRPRNGGTCAGAGL